MQLPQVLTQVSNSPPPIWGWAGAESSRLLIKAQSFWQTAPMPKLSRGHQTAPDGYGRWSHHSETPRDLETLHPESERKIKWKRHSYHPYHLGNHRSFREFCVRTRDRNQIYISYYAIQTHIANFIIKIRGEFKKT